MKKNMLRGGKPALSENPQIKVNFLSVERTSNNFIVLIEIITQGFVFISNLSDKQHKGYGYCLFCLFGAATSGIISMASLLCDSNTPTSFTIVTNRTPPSLLVLEASNIGRNTSELAFKAIFSLSLNINRFIRFAAKRCASATIS